jgi:Methyltransferase domain
MGVRPRPHLTVTATGSAGRGVRSASLHSPAVAAGAPDFDPYLNDPDGWGVSLAQMTELIRLCLDAAGVQSIAEVGAFAGDLTRVLVQWAQTSGARVVAIDPAPQDGLVTLAEEHPELQLVRRTSLEALPEIELPEAIVIDGDHNYSTVHRELEVIGGRAPGTKLPLLLFHDVRWPHGRRDDYFDPEQIPEDDRHPIVGAAGGPYPGGLYPGDPGVHPGGLPYPRSAAHEGGPRNGVLTAVEEFVAATPGVRLAVVPAFFGFGVAWHTDAPWSGEIARILDPFDVNPILERLEANRVAHLARAHVRRVEVWRLQERLSRQEVLLRRMLESSAFSVAERLSRLRAAAGIATEQSVVSKEEIRRVLDS